MAINNNIDSGIPIEISKGGTNTSSLSLTYGVLYYDGSKLMTVSSLGVNPQVLTSNGSAPPTFQSVSPSGPLSAFWAWSGASPSIETGDGTPYTAVFKAEFNDVGNDYDTGTGVFTAPFSGVYFLTSSLAVVGNFTPATAYNIKISTSNRDYIIVGYPPYEKMNRNAFCGQGYDLTKPISALADMDTSDVASIVFTVFGGTIDLGAGHGSRVYNSNYESTSFFSGCIIGT